jgi:hypothetical protein
MIVRPATDMDIDLCNKGFAECEPGMSLPDGYAAFLRQLNGSGFDVMEELDTFDAMFVGVVAPRI